MMKSPQPKNGCRIYLESRYIRSYGEHYKIDTINGKQRIRYGR